jgi:FAD/FMN-containing dehydrogenase
LRTSRARGLLPAALEILDQRTIAAVEASVFAAGYPRDAAAVLLVEIDGFDAGMDEDEEKIRAIVARNRAIELRMASDAAERLKLWKGRKGGLRRDGEDQHGPLRARRASSPARASRPSLNRVYEIAAKYRVTLSNVFPRGDGNLHPNISYDVATPTSARRVLDAGRENLQACVDAGGSISGEHGIGIEKMEFMPLLFTPEDLELQKALRHAVDPDELSNPCKVVPGFHAPAWRSEKAAREGGPPVTAPASTAGGAALAASSRAPSSLEAAFFGPDVSIRTPGSASEAARPSSARPRGAGRP